MSSREPTPSWRVAGDATSAYLLDGIGAGLYGAIVPVIVSDLMRGTGRFNVAAEYRHIPHVTAWTIAVLATAGVILRPFDWPACRRTVRSGRGTQQDRRHPDDQHAAPRRGGGRRHHRRARQQPHEQSAGRPDRQQRGAERSCARPSHERHPDRRRPWAQSVHHGSLATILWLTAAPRTAERQRRRLPEARHPGDAAGAPARGRRGAGGGMTSNRRTMTCKA